MTYLGAPNRGKDPLHVWRMVLALAAAAALGAGVGFLIELVSGDSEPATTTQSVP